MNRGIMVIGVEIALLASACGKKPEAAKAEFSQAAIDAALADPGRTTDRDGDARRKPGSLIALAGVGAGDKVLDLIPGNGYWTRIFSKTVGPTGRVYAIWPQNSPPATSAG
ncbi:MAG: hypothetical protein H0W65_00635 [Sphingomonas sp.]|uniref:hypothetical protein n=1 Tax=Sphingomonas sp. TaxID=28214 RepID=UPI0017BC5548|nr:hypothetical protein [Sphingomonas sp.]MBA3666216.1 hypothetical protein [Sphingomonas sp.]